MFLMSTNNIYGKEENSHLSKKIVNYSCYEKRIFRYRFRK